jgi:Pyruvate/2-oxoacid:ferredoxin oxidoreductase delta subunit
MKRQIIKIDEEKCTGCAECIPNCHEGALQIVDGKARLISDLRCDGLGACIGHCPEGAIELEEREAAPYDEVEVMEDMVTKGKNTVIAHLKHLREHGEKDLLNQGLQYLRENEEKLPFTIDALINELHGTKVVKNDEDMKEQEKHTMSMGCPGSKAMQFNNAKSETIVDKPADQTSALSHWPVQMHLINPNAAYYKNADLLIAADCSAYAYGGFHNDFLIGKSLAIACPKLDTGQEAYLEKIKSLIDDAKVNTITVLMMQVPCCGGLLQTVQTAANEAGRKVPVKAVIISVQGTVLREEWV